jgi:peptidoglycan/LPS O-acetylase OafA/YrhL
MQRSSFLDYLRHGLALMVIFSHSFPLVRGDNVTEPLMRLSGGYLTSGEFAVYGFFVLSGMLISASWRRDPQPLPFVSRRLARIVPAYVAAVVFSLVLGMLFNAFLSNPYPGALNSSIWTLRWEAFCYCLVVLLRGRVWIIAPAAAILAIGVGRLGSNIPLMIVAFAVGGLLTYMPRLPLPPLKGDLSYGLYVYAFPVQQVIVATLGSILSPLLLAFLTVLITVPIAALSWRWLESPALRLVTRLCVSHGSVARDQSHPSL